MSGTSEHIFSVLWLLPAVELKIREQESDTEPHGVHPSDFPRTADKLSIRLIPTN